MKPQGTPEFYTNRMEENLKRFDFITGDFQILPHVSKPDFEKPKFKIPKPTQSG